MRLGAHLDNLPWRWAIFFAGILFAWALLYAMQPSGAPGAPPGALEIFGADYWAALCRAGAADSSLAAVFAMWALMAAAMMAPTAVPAFRTFEDLTHTRAADGLSFAALIAGYLIAWLGFALPAAGLQMLLADAGGLDPQGRSLFAGVNALLLALAGLYQFSALKQACLSKCRTPMMFFMAHWRPGRSGAFAMGVKLGLFCVGCCWALMLLAFVGGVMSLLWMGGAMLLMTLEKLPALGRHVTRPLGYLLLAASGWMLLGSF
jgi:predicted metal-binding membrane protein